MQPQEPTYPPPYEPVHPPQRPRWPATSGLQRAIFVLLALNLLMTGYVFVFVWQLVHGVRSLLGG